MLAIHELERNMRINEDVLRYLTVRIDEIDEGPSVMMQSRGGRDDRGRGRRDDRDRDDQVGEPDRGAAPHVPTPLDPGDERIERERQEDRDRHPGEHLAGDPDDLDHDRDAEDEREHAQDGARAQIDDAIASHPTSIAPAADITGHSRDGRPPGAAWYRPGEIGRAHV